MSLLSHEDKGLRAAAAKGLGGHKDRPIIDALIRLATEDKEGEVRAAALVAVKSSSASKAQDMVCTAMIEDESPLVRSAAVRSFKGTKRESAVACLVQKRLKKKRGSR